LHHQEVETKKKAENAESGTASGTSYNSSTSSLSYQKEMKEDDRVVLDQRHQQLKKNGS
jgi:hypothetical protein